MMLIIQYKHPLHGKQNIQCHELKNIEGVLHVKNVHGVTFQTIEATRIDHIHPISQ